MTQIELFGLVSVVLMVTFYALENVHPTFILFFAFACGLAAIYAFLIGSYPFMIAEGIWSMIACYRWSSRIRAR